MGRKLSNFILESKGLCFLCSYRAPHSPSVSIHSFQHLSHYLQIDMGKVFSGDGPIPPHLLAKVQKSKLKVELCSDCATVNQHFLELFRKLEKIALEMGAILEVIMQKLEKLDHKNNQTEEFEVDETMTEIDKLLIKQKSEIVKTMREETKQKCYTKLQTLSVPRVRVQNFTLKQIVGEMDQLKRKSLKHKPSSLTTASSGQPKESESEPVIMALLKTETEDLTEDPNFPDEISNTDANSDLDSNLFVAESDEEVELYRSSPPQSKETKGNGKSVNWREKYSINAKTDKHTCKDCLMTFVSFPTFYHHYNRQHLGIRHKCSACNKSFTQIGNLNLHQRQVHNGVKFKCSACNQLFSLESHLSKHRKANICKPSAIYDESKSNLIILPPSKSPKDVQKLLENCWDSQSMKHKCSICSNEFEKKAGLRIHFKSAHMQIRLKCGLCQQIFNSRKQYRLHHLREHIGVRFKCPKCQKLFTQEKSLSKHLQSVRACKVGKVKKLKKDKKPPPKIDLESDRALTIIRHEDTSKFKCSLCSKIYSNRKSFRKHYGNVHSNITYTCDSCERQFSSIHARNEHHKYVHLKVRHRCLKCNKQFSWKSALWSHQNKYNTRCSIKLVSNHKVEHSTGTPEENA